MSDDRNFETEGEAIESGACLLIGEKAAPYEKS